MKQEFPLDIMSHEIQLYERSVKRYPESCEPVAPADEFMEIYIKLRESLYEAQKQLSTIDEFAEHRFKDHLDTSDFERMRRALDKCAERLQWSTERNREMGYFLRKMLQNFEEPPK